MTNPYYTATGEPGTGAFAASAPMRSEFQDIEDGFNLLPALTAGTAVVVNSAGTALANTVGKLALAGDFITTGAFAVTLAASAAVTLTLPAVSGTLATLAGTETLSNKTFGSNVALGTPVSGVATNLTGTAVGLTAGNATNAVHATTADSATTATTATTVITNANLTGPITSVGNATSVAAQTGAGTTFAMQDSPSFTTPSLGVATATSINGLTITASTGTLTLTNGKTFSVAKSITLDGTDGTTMTFPSTSATIARTDAANTFTGIQTFSTPIAAGSVATMTATVGGGVPTPPNNTTTFLRGDGTFAVPASSGTVNSGTAGQLAYYATSTTAVSGNANATISNGAMTLGVAGSVVGTLALTNTTSGSITLATPSGALGSVTLTLPAATDTLVGKATTDTLSNKTLVAPVLGAATATSINKMAITAPATSSTLAVADGKTFTASNTMTLAAGADGQTWTFPSSSDTVVTLGATQTLTNKTLTAAALGSSTATTQTANDNSTKVATTAYVDAAVGGAGAATAPQGRLTLTSATPVLTGGVSSATTIYYALYECGSKVPIYNGSSFVMTTFAELSNVLANSSTGKAGPAAAANNSNYDMFIWSDSGTVRLTRGPAWSSDTSRGTGAGTTELQYVLGFLTNKVAITNGPGAGLGTYVGTIRTDGSARCNWIPGGSGAGGVAAILGVWNLYNRVSVAVTVYDTTSSWNYSTATWRSADNSNNNRVSFVYGLQEDVIEAAYATSQNGSSTSVYADIGVGYDSTSATSGSVSQGNSVSATAAAAMPPAHYEVQPIGAHYFQALENGGGTATCTFFGNNGTQFFALTVRGMF